MNRKSALVSGGLAGAMLLSGCGGGGSTLTANVKMSGVTAENLDGAAANYCPRPEGIEKLVGRVKRLKMRVVDKNDEVLATSFSDTTYTEDMKPISKGCTITVVFENVPDADFYTIQADIDESNFGGEKTASLTYSKDEMVEKNWIADLVITEG